MQDVFNFVNEWCRKWRLIIDFSKKMQCILETKEKDVVISICQVGNQTVDYVSVYRYLGVHLNEHMDSTITAETLSKAGWRALRAVISKIQSYKDVEFKTYSQLYNSCVVPVLDCCSGVWGFKSFDIIDMIQNWAIRYFMGVHRFTPILANTGDMGWVVSTSRRWANFLRLWNRLVNMHENRLTKKIFSYDYSMPGGKSWCSDGKTILTEVDLLTNFYDKTPIDLK